MAMRTTNVTEPRPMLAALRAVVAIQVMVALAIVGTAWPWGLVAQQARAAAPGAVGKAQGKAGAVGKAQGKADRPGDARQLAMVDQPAALPPAVAKAVAQLVPGVPVTRTLLRTVGRQRYYVAELEAEPASFEVEVGLNGELREFEAAIPVGAAPAAVQAAVAREFPNSVHKLLLKTEAEENLVFYEVISASERDARLVRLNAQGQVVPRGDGGRPGAAALKKAAQRP